MLLCTAVAAPLCTSFLAVFSKAFATLLRNTTTGPAPAAVATELVFFSGNGLVVSLDARTSAAVALVLLFPPQVGGAKDCTKPTWKLKTNEALA